MDGEIMAAGEWAEISNCDSGYIEEGLFQAHLLPGNRLKLIPVKLKTDLERCPIILGGERCGGKAGHSGKHFWAGGD